MSVLQTSIYVFIFLCKMDYNNDKFVHAPIYVYNEVIQLLEFVNVLEYSSSVVMCCDSGVFILISQILGHDIQCFLLLE
jgi:hypothetical protein